LVAKGLPCPRCGATAVDTRSVREMPNGATFKRQMPLVRFLAFVPVMSLMEIVSFKALLVTAAAGGAYAGLAAFHNRRGLAASRPFEMHACRKCGYGWQHPAGAPEPAAP
jgi:hypothetical protein